MDLSDQDILELLDWHPDSSVWRSEWLDLYDRAPEGGLRNPSPEWIEWARGVFSQPISSHAEDAIARVLFVAQTLHFQGLDRRRLQDALLALGRLHGRDYRPAEVLVEMAERNGVIRMERKDLWRPGMASGSGWRAFCRLTLHGKSLVKASTMPDVFPPPATRTTESWRRNTPPVTNWMDRLKKQDGEQRLSAEGEPEPTCAIANDFAWTGPYVDQKVRQFFRRHRDEYLQGIRDAIDERTEMKDFGLQFGPKRISTWINNLLSVPEDHPNPCSRQNINASPTYAALVKSFKGNPLEHSVVRKLRYGRSEEAQAILDDLLGDGDPS